MDGKVTMNKRHAMGCRIPAFAACGVTHALPWVIKVSLVQTLLALLLSSPVRADTHYVWTNSPSSIPPYTNWATAATSIQDAVNASATGDVVLVTNGYYVLSQELLVDRAVEVRSVTGARYTTLDGQNACRCVSMTDRGALMEGFTLTKGYYGWCGNYAIGTLKKCIIRNCYAQSTGKAFGAVYLGGGRLENCLIYANTARGGGLSPRAAAGLGYRGEPSSTARSRGTLCSRGPAAEAFRRPTMTAD